MEPAKKAPARKVAPLATKSVIKKAPASLAKNGIALKEAARRRQVTHKKERNTKEGKQGKLRSHLVYVIKVRSSDPKITYDYYVGSTGLTLEKKWESYASPEGKRISSKFRKGSLIAEAYAHKLMAGWGPYENRDLREYAEGELALHLQDRGFAVYSDELAYAEGRRLKSGVITEIPVWNSKACLKAAKAASVGTKSIRDARKKKKVSDR